VGRQLADVPMILVGVDPCFSCNDRMMAISRGGEQHEHWTWEDLRRYGIEYYQGIRASTFREAGQQHFKHPDNLLGR
jgi:NADH-quinone oxidoreductase subunit D